MKLPAILLAAALFFLLFHEKHISSFDPASFVLMLKHGYSVSDTRPHPPGYPGFFVLWKSAQLITGLSPFSIILCFNVCFSLLALALTYWVGSRLSDDRMGLCATLLVLTNPLFLFYGSSVEIYAYDTAFSAALIGLLLVRSKKFETPLYFLYGLLGSFRLSSVILTLPVVLALLAFRYFRRNDHNGLKNILAILIGTLCWALPFAAVIGDWSRCVALIRELSKNTENVAENLAAFIPFTMWTAGVIFLIIAFKWRRLLNLLRSRDERFIVLASLILVPAIYFSLKYYAKGYGLIYVVPMALLAAQAIGSYVRWRVVLSLAVAVNLLIFFVLPCIPPSSRSLLNRSHRTQEERWQTALLRATSFFAPTWSRSVAMERSWDVEDSLLAEVPANSDVIVETSGISPQPRALQVEFPLLSFLQPVRDNPRLLQWFHGASTGDDFDLLASALRRPVYYLTTSDLRCETGILPARFLKRQGGFELYIVDQESSDAMLHFLDEYFVNSYNP